MGFLVGEKNLEGQVPGAFVVAPGGEGKAIKYRCDTYVLQVTVVVLVLSRSGCRVLSTMQCTCHTYMHLFSLSLALSVSLPLVFSGTNESSGKGRVWAGKIKQDLFVSSA